MIDIYLYNIINYVY